MDKTSLQHFCVLAALGAAACSSGLPDFKRPDAPAAMGGAGSAARERTPTSPEVGTSPVIAAGGGAGTKAVPEATPKAGAGGAMTARTTTDGAAARPCGAEDPSNDVRETATPLVPGTDVRACIDVDGDQDWFELSVPAEDKAGGYFSLAITAVDKGRLVLKGFVTSDNTQILSAASENSGSSFFQYFAGAPGQKYRLRLSENANDDNNIFEYTLRATYTKINDPLEPNDTLDTAAPIQVGTTIESYFFAGFTTTTVPIIAYDDWYSFSANVGQVTISATSVPTNVSVKYLLKDSSGNNIPFIAGDYTTTYGADFAAMAKIEQAGQFRVKVAMFNNNVEETAKSTSAGQVADNFTRPYKLTVSQP